MYLISLILKSFSLKPRFCLLLFFCVISIQSLLGQKKSAFVSGKIFDENEHPLAKVSIIILGKQTGIVASDSGTFRMKVPADKAFALVFSFTGYKTEQRNFLLNEQEEERVVIRLEKNAQQ